MGSLAGKVSSSASSRRFSAVSTGFGALCFGLDMSYSAKVASFQHSANAQAPDTWPFGLAIDPCVPRAGRSARVCAVDPSVANRVCSMFSSRALACVTCASFTAAPFLEIAAQ